MITKGGGAVNAIPNDVRVESYVRGASIEAIVSANNRINRALASSAAAMGANVHLQDFPGYCPLYNDKNLYQLTVDVVKEAFGEEWIQEDTKWGTGCTDMGDICLLYPSPPGKRAPGRRCGPGGGAHRGKAVRERHREDWKGTRHNETRRGGILPHPPGKTALFPKGRSGRRSPWPCLLYTS